jgi:putative peptidoglycan binding protein
MPLRSARLAGDPVLEECFAERHRMLSGEQGLPVMRVQQALIDLGRSVGPLGADGTFGFDTGTAVSAYKVDKGLSPSDPVVGPGTARALDDDFFFDPPRLDPTFAEFSPAVVDRRLEPFVALELSALLHTPLDSWRHMLGIFALTALNSGQLLGIVAQSRAIDLRLPFLAVADPIQGGRTADEFFDDSIVAGDALATTFTFLAGGQQRAFIVIRDDVILGRATVVRSATGTRAAVTLQGVVVHELTHARNLGSSLALRATADTDASVYADTALAVARSAAATPTANVLVSFVDEIVARHVHWVVLKEIAGSPGTLAVRALSPEQLAAAAFFYFVEVPRVYDSNGYGVGIAALGRPTVFRQLDQWLRLCAQQSFSDIADADQQSTLVFQAAAQVCAAEVAAPSLDVSNTDGLFPLAQNFV